VRGFEASGLVIVCAVESTAHVTEQLAFEQMFRVTGAIDRDERTFGTSTPSMDLMCKGVFAGAALTGEENCSVAGGGAFRLLQQSLHHRSVRFEQRNKFVGRAQHRTIQIFAFFVHDQSSIEKSVTAFKPDNVYAKTLGTVQQIGIDRAAK